MSEAGTIAIIGAPYDDEPNGEQGGSAYIFDGSGGAWSQQHKLTGEDGDQKDRFGEAVAVSADGNTTIIGAPHDEDSNGHEAGSAYVFESTGESWAQEGKLSPTDGDDGDHFGKSVGVSGARRTAIISAPNDEDPNGQDAGSAYVFEKENGAWSQQSKLAADEGEEGDFFGWSVAVSDANTTAIIGSPSEENPNGMAAGSVYVFEQSGSTRSQQARIIAEDGDEGDYFGWSCGLSSDGTTALIGAPHDEDPNGTFAGSAYIFKRSGTTWSQQAKLVAGDGDEGDFFGMSGALSNDGTTAVVSARRDEDPNGEGAGSAYVFEEAEDRWSQKAKLVGGDGEEGDFFGWSVATSADGSNSLVSAAWDRDKDGTQTGSAYVFNVQ